MNLEQRDIVLLRFPFPNLGGSKVRPAIVISNNQYKVTRFHRGCHYLEFRGPRLFDLDF
jgi:hypothetical protein